MKIIITESQYSALTRRYASSIPLEELVDTFLNFLGVKKSETFDDFYSKVKKHVMFRIKHDMLMKDMLDTTDYVNNKLNSLTQKIENDVHSYIDDNLKDKIEDYYNRHSKKTSKKKSNLDENDDEHIKKVLKEETSLQKNLMGLFKDRGIKVATAAVGGLDNFSKILNLNLDDLKTQEMLVKNFINHTELEGINISFLEINRNKPDKVRIKIQFDTNVYTSNVESWVTRTMSDEINKFFTFKSAAIWEPAFANRGVTIILDSDQIITEDDEDEMDLQETELTEKCWKGYTQKGMKTMFGKRYPNCVKIKK